MSPRACCLLPLVAIALAACTPVAAPPANDAQPKAAGTPATANGSVLGLTVCESWVDGGIKVLIFTDGTGYAFRLHPPSDGELAKPGAEKDDVAVYAAIRLAPADRQRLEQAFADQRFAEIPASLRNPVTDGTDVILVRGDRGGEHHVHDYMHPDQRFDSLHALFDRLAGAALTKGDAMLPADLLAAVAARVAALPEGSGQRIAAAEWLDLVARILASSLPSETVLPYYLPGDGSVLMRDGN